jgi:F-type H+-transporting ATPase subunit delta
MAVGSGARRYAQALLDIATEERAVAAYRESLDKLARGLDTENIRGLRDQRVPFARRRAALDAAVQGEPKAMRAVLAILLERDRIEIVPDIARAFAELVDRREGVVKAKITTPVEIAAAQRDDLVRRLEQASGQKIRATFQVDPALIGGARVQLGDRLIDASLHTQLEHLAREMASS